jgi:hypothetical protein
VSEFQKAYILKLVCIGNTMKRSCKTQTKKASITMSLTINIQFIFFHLL